MAENIIDLDPDTIAAIDRAAELLQDTIAEKIGRRQVDEFTSDEFAERVGLTTRQVSDVLTRGARAGKLTRRKWVNEDGHGCYLYRTVEPQS